MEDRSLRSLEQFSVEKDAGFGWEGGVVFGTYAEALAYFEDREQRFTATSYRLVRRRTEFEQMHVIERGIRGELHQANEVSGPYNSTPHKESGI